MRTSILVLCMITIFSLLAAEPISLAIAQNAALSHLSRLQKSSDLSLDRILQRSDSNLAYIFTLQPAGYIVVCADDDLPPVLAYSFNSSFEAADSDLLADMVQEDISRRLQYLEASTRLQNQQLWQNLNAPRDPFQQWPPEGSTATEGWVKTEWTQNAPYSDMCPMDPVTNIRSIAGCPAVAMAQIVNYHQTINGTTFSDEDDYYHNYAGRTYWIDNDAVARDFPTWPELNNYLVDLVFRYRHHQETTTQGKAALTFACGVAAQQVYTSSGSGTFGVAQAFAAYQKFGFQDIELLTDTAPDLYNRMAQNIMDATPVHLAIVTPAWDAGHNVVVDGYNTDNYFHLNFGWGGSYSGWYLLPSEIPYNLTVIEGAIVDIHPRQYLFAVPEAVDFTDPLTVYDLHNLEVINISDAPLMIDAIYSYPQFVQDAMLVIYPDIPYLPLILQPGQSLNLGLQWDVPVSFPRELIHGSIEITHEFAIYSVPIEIDGDLLYTDVDDEVQPPVSNVSVYPNPFREGLTIKADSADEFSVRIFNLKGQCVKALGGSGELVWDGTNEQGNIVADGIYLIKTDQQAYPRWRKVIKLK